MIDLWGLLDHFIEFIFPSKIYCISCGKPIDGRYPYSLCASCVRTLQWANRETCQRCGKPLRTTTIEGLCGDCMKWDRPFQQAYTCVRYGRAERDIVHQFKYHGRPYYGRHLAELMNERLQVEDLNEDMILPVPMHKDKERRRGYNQAALLAQALSKKRKTAYEPHLLIRQWETVPMSRLGADGRRENIKNVFLVDPRKKVRLTGKTILLVDDVFTTGSTAGSCAEALLEAGAASIFVITFAAGADL